MANVIAVGICLAIGSLICWSIRDSVKRNGWDGFVVKAALYFNCLAVCFIVLVPQIPWRTMTSANDIHFNVASIIWLMILYVVCVFLLMSNRATPWLLKPAVKWPLIGGFALGWIALTGSAFIIVCLYLAKLRAL